MSEHLKDLMDRAADIDFAPVDVAGIVATGDRTVRRRRRTRAAGVAAVAAVVAVVVTAAVRAGGTDRADDLPAVGSRAAEVTWVSGRTLQTPTVSIELGWQPRSLVRLAVGFGLLDGDGRVFTLVDGRLAQVGDGATGDTPLVGDETGTRLGWVDRSSEVPVFTTLDVATGDVERNDENLDAQMGAGAPPNLAWYFAIDGDTAYWLDRRGLVAHDLGGGRDEVLRRPDDASWIGDVTDGLIVRLVEDRDGGDLGSEVVDRDFRPVVPLQRGRYLGVVSPDGNWVTGEDGVATVVEVATGRRIALAIEDQGYGYEWLDTTTVAVMREEGDSLALATCTVPSGECRTVVDDLDPASLLLPRTSQFG